MNLMKKAYAMHAPQFLPKTCASWKCFLQWIVFKRAGYKIHFVYCYKPVSIYSLPTTCLQVLHAKINTKPICSWYLMRKPAWKEIRSWNKGFMMCYAEREKSSMAHTSSADGHYKLCTRTASHWPISQTCYYIQWLRLQHSSWLSCAAINDQWGEHHDNSYCTVTSGVASQTADVFNTHFR